MTGHMKWCPVSLGKGKPCDCGFDMNLPTGKTCSDCAHAKRCGWLLSRKGDETSCDWAPSRFMEASK